MSEANPPTPNPPDAVAPGQPPSPAPADGESSGINVMVVVAAIALLLIGALLFMIARSGMEGSPEGEFVTTKSGLQYIDIKVGAGQVAKKGDTVSVHYTGTLKDGAKFDSSRDRDEPFSFPLGAGKVIKGWDEGVAGMKVGGKRKLIVPYQLGYGERGSGAKIPAFAELHFDVELLSIDESMFSPH